MWQYPWRYKESIAIIGGIILVGFLLQVTVGQFPFSLLHFPVNIIIGGCIIGCLLLFSTQRKSSFYRWFSGVPFSVTLIGAVLILGVIMGLTPNQQITTSWSFVLVYTLLLLSLGSLIIRRLIAFRFQDYAFYLNHIGLWLLLFSAGLGAADIKRYVMHIREGEVEWRVYSENKDVLELPIAIQLNDFQMEEYPPKLVVINRTTGATQPENKPAYLHLDGTAPTNHIRFSKWNIQLEDYIHEAIRNSDSTYHEVRMPGASPAARIKVTNIENKEENEGWVCVGNISQLYMTFNLDSTYCVVMTQPEPRRFVSDVNVFTEDGKETHALLEVNKPHKIGNWMLYQFGYDNDAGKLSTYSSIELVYDPWLIPAYCGIILLAFGSVCMLWIGNRKKRRTK